MSITGPNSKKLLTGFDEKIKPAESATTKPNSAILCCRFGDCTSSSMVLGKMILQQATIHSEGIKKMANGLKIKITAGAKTNIILSHQYSGRAAASKPYRGSICVIEISTITEAQSQKASCKYLLPWSKTVEVLSKRLVIKVISSIAQIAIMAKERLRPSPTFSAASNC